MALAFIVIALSIYVLVLPHVLETLIGQAFTTKLLISALLLVPLGFAMGMPFPSGLRALSVAKAGEDQVGHGAVEWAWAMNAASSVLGSVLAIVIAIQFGLTVTLGCGVVAYVAGDVVAADVWEEGSWQLALGGSHFAIGSWLLAVSDWQPQIIS